MVEDFALLLIGTECPPFLRPNFSFARPVSFLAACRNAAQSIFLQYGVALAYGPVATPQHYSVAASC